ncbi:SOS response-associated peptidase family protein [Schnuerera sp.]
MFVIITTESNKNMKVIHSRMPLIIKADDKG